MSKAPADRDKPEPVPTGKKLDDLYTLIEDIETAMLTTRRDEGGERNGEPGDPRFALIFVDAHSVTYMKNDKPRPVILFEVMKGMVTGDFTDIGSLRHLDRGELGGAR